MSKFFSLLMLLCVVCSISHGKVFLDLDVETDKPPMEYKVGETMTYTLRAVVEGISADGLIIRYYGKGDDGKTYSGQGSAAKPLVVKASLDRPGFVNINAELLNGKGEVIFTGGRYLRIYCGTAAEPEKLEACEEPADFDKFWAGQRARLDAVPFVGKVERKKIDTRNGVDFYTVKIPCAGSRPATGYLCIPVDAGDKTLPAEIHFLGYGTMVQKCPYNMPPDRISLQINAHGQELERELDYYKRFFLTVKSNGYKYAFDPVQNSKPETAYFNGMVLRIMRALDYLKTLPQWNRKDLIAFGGSQGGTQTIWAAALDPDVSEAYPSITGFCDMEGSEKLKRGIRDKMWQIKYTPGLGYYDPVYMAKRIKNARVIVRRAGLGDYVCPPVGQVICYKNLATPRKMILWMQKSDHGYIPKNPEIILWAEPEFMDTIFNISTDKSADSYKTKDEITVKVNVDLRGIDLKNMTLRCSWYTADGRRVFCFDRADRELTVKTSLDRPGNFDINVELLDQQGNPVLFSKQKAEKAVRISVKP